MSAPGLPLAHRLLLVRWLTDALAALRKDDLLPEAEKTMPSGSRIPVLFGDELAGWASMPEPSKRQAYVSDERKLLAWAEREHPDHVADTVSVVVDDRVLAVLAEHCPEALRRERAVDEHWVADIRAALRDPGYYVTAEGEKLTEVPGITVPDPSPPVPHVTLKPQATAIIAEAWRHGFIQLDDVLALPSGEA